MLSVPRTRNLAWSALALACCLTFASVASAQVPPTCSITGLSSVCNGSAQLCGPDGNFTYSWTGPGGFSASTQCVNAGTTGTYSLTITDIGSGLQSTCTHDLTVTTVPAATITGPNTACAGSSIHLCGPAGFLYEWHDSANNVIGTTQCIDVTVAGTYILFLRDPVTFCEGAPAFAKVTFTPCETKTNCPRTVGFWGAQCAQKHNGSTKFNLTQLGQIASCVDASSSFFNFGSNPVGGFCALISTDNMDQRVQAKRQYAGVLANICTGSLGLIANNGDKVTLDPTTTFTCGGTTETIGDFLAAADAQLAANEGLSLDDPAVKAIYETIIECADNINNGIGIGPLCVFSTTNSSLGAGNAALGGEMTGDSQLAFGRVSPNPFAGAMSMRYAIGTQDGANVDIGVFDLAGRLVKSLDSGFKSAGVYEVRWDGTNTAGARAGAGVYFIRGRVGDRQLVSRVTMLNR